MKILITGAKGQLGKEFVKKLEHKKKKFLALGHAELDITDLEKIIEVFESFKPDIVINCSAYNLVDKAEKDNTPAIKVNALGVRNLAFMCKKKGAFLVHYSTDYVFDGEKEGLYNEEDTPNPLNEYGKSKLLGEKFLREETDKYLIFRTSWVYGEGKQNFIYKLLQWTETQEYLKIACDEFSVPTYTGRIVEITLKALEEGLTGLYHLVNSEYASRYEWAKEVFKLKGIKKFIYPVPRSYFNLPAKRPKFSAMNNEKLSRILAIEIPPWQEDLTYFIKKCWGS